MKKTAGFTLVELLVVVAIIGLLSAIGMVVFADAQAKGRDAKRRADIDSIAKALEIHKTDNGGYQALDAAWLGSSTGLPTTDPKTNPYCISTNATANPSNTAAWTVCSSISGGGSSASWVAVAGGQPTVSSGTVNSWRVCAFLENPGGTAQPYCRSNLQ